MVDAADLVEKLLDQTWPQLVACGGLAYGRGRCARLVGMVIDAESAVARRIHESPVTSGLFSRLGT